MGAPSATGTHLQERSFAVTPVGGLTLVEGGIAKIITLEVVKPPLSATIIEIIADQAIQVSLDEEIWGDNASIAFTPSDARFTQKSFSVRAFDDDLFEPVGIGNVILQAHAATSPEGFPPDPVWSASNHRVEYTIFDNGDPLGLPSLKGARVSFHNGSASGSPIPAHCGGSNLDEFTVPADLLALGLPPSLPAGTTCMQVTLFRPFSPTAEYISVAASILTVGGSPRVGLRLGAMPPATSGTGGTCDNAFFDYEIGKNPPAAQSVNQLESARCVEIFVKDEDGGTPESVAAGRELDTVGTPQARVKFNDGQPSELSTMMSCDGADIGALAVPEDVVAGATPTSIPDGTRCVEIGLFGLSDEPVLSVAAPLPAGQLTIRIGSTPPAEPAMAGATCSEAFFDYEIGQGIPAVPTPSKIAAARCLEVVVNDGNAGTPGSIVVGLGFPLGPPNLSVTIEFHEGEPSRVGGDDCTGAEVSSFTLPRDEPAAPDRDFSCVVVILTDQGSPIATVALPAGLPGLVNPVVAVSFTNGREQTDESCDGDLVLGLTVPPQGGNSAVDAESTDAPTCVEVSTAVARHAQEIPNLDASVTLAYNTGDPVGSPLAQACDGSGTRRFVFPGEIPEPPVPGEKCVVVTLAIFGDSLLVLALPLRTPSANVGLITLSANLTDGIADPSNALGSCDGESLFEATILPSPEILDVFDPDTELDRLSCAQFTLGMEGQTSSAALSIRHRVKIVAVDDAAAEPGDDSAIFQIMRQGGSNHAPLVVDIGVGCATTPCASAAADLSNVPNLVMIPAGQSSITLPITPRADNVFEQTEYFTIFPEPSSALAIGNACGSIEPTCMGPGNYNVDPTTPAAEAHIINQVIQVEIATADGEAKEFPPADQDAVFTLTRIGGDQTQPLPVGVMVDTSASSANPDTDFMPVPSSVTIPANQAFMSLVITAKNDPIIEPIETITIQVVDGFDYDPILGSQQASAFVLDAEPTVRVVSDDSATGIEGDEIKLQIERSGDDEFPLEVAYALIPGPGPTTYEVIEPATPTAVMIPAGQTIVDVTIRCAVDGFKEPAQDVQLALTPPTNYFLHDGETTLKVTILDDSPTVNVEVMDHGSEDGSPAKLQFGRTQNGDLTAPLPINLLKIGDGVGFVPNSFDIPPDLLVATLEIPILNDAVIDPEQSFTVSIDSGNYLIGEPAFVELHPNDFEAEFQIVPLGETATEGSATDVARFKLLRTGDLEGPRTVEIEVVEGPGLASLSEIESFSPPPPLVFPAESSELLLTVQVANDLVYEGAETLRLRIAPHGPDYHIGPTNQASITILDDEPVLIVAASPDMTEEGDPSTPGIFTIHRTGDASDLLEVQYEILQDDASPATPGLDYADLDGVATIPAQSSTVEIPILAQSDSEPEPAETIHLRLKSTPAYGIGLPSDAVVTIIDAAANMVRVNAVTSILEEDGTANALEFGVHAARPFPLEIQYETGGSATAGVDYEALPGSITIPPGQLFMSVPVHAINDPWREGTETIVLSINAAPTYLVAPPGVAVLDIEENEPTVSITALDNQASECGTTAGSVCSDTASFGFTRDGDLQFDLSVSYLSSGTATLDTDYQGLPGLAIIPAGASLATITITPIDDNLAEGDETATVTVTSDGFRYAVAPGPNHVATAIIHDDLPTISITLGSDAVAGEASQGDPGEFLITRRSGDIEGPLTVSYVLEGTATNGVDYTMVSGAIEFTSGQTTAVVQVVPIEDGEAEGAETVTVRLIAASAYLVGPNEAATLDLLDNDDPTLTLIVLDARTTEDAGDVAGFRVTRSVAGPSSLPVQLLWSGAAVQGVDYLDPGPVTIPAESLSVDIDVQALPDPESEGDETIRVNLIEGFGYLVGAPSNAQLTVKDSDLVRVSLNTIDGSAAEANPATDHGILALRREGVDADTGVAVSLQFTGTATKGIDYHMIPSTISIPVGESQVTLDIHAIDDLIGEGTETVTASIAPGPYLADPSTATVVIADNDNEVTARFMDTESCRSGTYEAACVQEGHTGGAVFRVTRAGELGIAIAIPYAVQVSSGLTDSDYAIPATAVVLESGQASVDIFVDVRDDAIAEADETLTLILSPGPDYLLGSPSSASVVLRDNGDPRVSITVVDGVADEFGADGSAPDIGRLRVTRLGRPDTLITVAVSTLGSTATKGIDYAIVPQDFVIPSGTEAIFVDVKPLADANVTEGAEVAKFSLLPGAGYAVGEESSATVTIRDDALPAITSITPAVGQAKGGNPVTVHGSNLRPGTRLLLDPGAPNEREASNIIFVNESEFTATLPAHPVGIVDVRILVPTADGTFSHQRAATLDDGFRFVTGPAIDSVTPNEGLPSGEQAVTITGTGFREPTEVRFDSSIAAILSQSSTMIRVRTPAHDAGIVDVALKNGDGFNAILVDGFTYILDSDGDGYGDSAETMAGSDPESIASTPLDLDADGHPNGSDNCATVSNGDQRDGDADRIGDACDDQPQNGPRGDLDGDHRLNMVDNCRFDSNENQADADGDLVGDACDENPLDGPKGDLDFDGIANQSDNCKDASNASQRDGDRDGKGNACDSNPEDGPGGDLDGDAHSNEAEAHARSDPNDARSTPLDLDGDLRPNDSDNCPAVKNQDQADRDGDVIGDACDSNAPTLTGLRADPFMGGARIWWNVEGVSHAESRLEYGVTSALGGRGELHRGRGLFNDTITGIAPGALVRFRITATNPGLGTISANDSFQSLTMSGQSVLEDPVFLDSVPTQAEAQQGLLFRYALPEGIRQPRVRLVDSSLEPVKEIVLTQDPVSGVWSGSGLAPAEGEYTVMLVYSRSDALVTRLEPGTIRLEAQPSSNTPTLDLFALLGCLLGPAFVLRRKRR